jgi:hypothetical protein
MMIFADWPMAQLLYCLTWWLLACIALLLLSGLSSYFWMGLQADFCSVFCSVFSWIC